MTVRNRAQEIADEIKANRAKAEAYPCNREDAHGPHEWEQIANSSPSVVIVTRHCAGVAEAQR